MIALAINSLAAIGALVVLSVVALVAIGAIFEAEMRAERERRQ